MKADLRIILSIAIVVIILLLITCSNVMAQFDKSIYGMWIADIDYKEKAALDAFFIFISPPFDDNNNSINIIGSKCNVFVLIKADGQTKYNGVVKTFIRRTCVLPSGIIKYKLDFGKKIDIMPRFVSLKYDPVTSMLVLYSGNKLFGRMFKKPEPSFYCRAQKNTDDEDTCSDNESDDESD